MKWLLVLVLLAAGAVGINAWASGPDLTCPGATLSGIPEGGPLSPTADEALGDRLDDAARVTDEANGDKGFETVTFRGYDADGELIRTVVVEGPVEWRVARVDTCE
jgi:hypothetical protein